MGKGGEEERRGLKTIRQPGEVQRQRHALINVKWEQPKFLLTVVHTDTKLGNSPGIRENSRRKWGVAPEDKRVVHTYPAGRSVRKHEAIEERQRVGEGRGPTDV